MSDETEVILLSLSLAEFKALMCIANVGIQQVARGYVPVESQILAAARVDELTPAGWNALMKRTQKLGIAAGLTNKEYKV